MTFLGMVSRVVNSSLDIDSVLKLLMDSAVELVNAERGFILLRDRRGLLQFRVARNLRREDLRAEKFQISRTVVDRVLELGQPLLIHNAAEDPDFCKNPSVRQFGLRSILCVPLVSKGALLGAIYLDNRLLRGAFVESDLNLIAMLADQTAVALCNAAIQQEHARTRQFLARYVSPEVADTLLSSEDGPFLEGRTVDATVLFADIDGFTSLAERMDPPELLDLLNDHFSRMVDIVFSHEGMVNKFVGDELMAVFGAPASRPDHVQKAIHCALDMRDELLRWAAERQFQGLPTFSMKVGLHTGIIVAGSLGSPERMEYAVIGDVVNTASRIMALSDRFRLTNSVLASEEVVERSEDGVRAHPLGSAEVKGRRAPVSVFQLSKT